MRSEVGMVTKASAYVGQFSTRFTAKTQSGQEAVGGDLRFTEVPRLILRAPLRAALRAKVLLAGPGLCAHWKGHSKVVDSLLLR